MFSVWLLWMFPKCHLSSPTFLIKEYFQVEGFICPNSQDFHFKISRCCYKLSSLLFAQSAGLSCPHTADTLGSSSVRFYDPGVMESLTQSDPHHQLPGLSSREQRMSIKYRFKPSFQVLIKRGSCDLKVNIDCCHCWPLVIPATILVYYKRNLDLLCCVEHLSLAGGSRDSILDCNTV